MTKDAVWAYLTKMYKKTGELPTQAEIAKELELPLSTVKDDYRLLQKDGKLRKSWNGKSWVLLG